MSKLSFLLVLLLSWQFAFSQINHPKNKQELIGVCDKFMDIFRSGKYQDAFNLIKPYTVIEDYKLDTLAKSAREQMIGLSSSFGKAISFEQISEKPVKSSLSRLLYILKFEKSFLRFRFILYNNGEGWTITGVKYDTQLDDLF